MGTITAMSPMVSCLLLLSAVVLQTKGNVFFEEDPIFTKAGDGSLPFSKSVRVGNLLFLSGQIGIKTDGTLAMGFKGQFELTMNKIKESLKENGATWDDVIKTTIMLKDIKDYKQMNDIYKTFFKTNYPARSAYQVAALPLGAVVEVEVIAFVQ